MKPIVKLRQLTDEEILKWTTNSVQTKVDSIENHTGMSHVGMTLSTSANFIGRVTRLTTNINGCSKETRPDGQSTKKRKSDCSIGDDLKCKKKKITRNTIIETKESENAMEASSDQNISSTVTIAVNLFVVGEVIWGKIRGWPHWPAKIIHLKGKFFEVEWFNDYRTTKLYRSQVYKFYPNYDLFAEKFDKTVGLKTAANDALLYISSKL